MAGKQKPNLGNFSDPPDWEAILAHFRGSELQGYFTKILEEKMRTVMKPQYVDHIPRAAKGKVNVIIKAKDERNVMEEHIKMLELTNVLDREIGDLSGEELQRFAIAMVCVRDADMYMFDEPSSYLDVRQRLEAARVIRRLLTPTNFVLVVEHAIYFA